MNVYQFDFSGGNVCLDFVNTLGDRPRCQEEHLDGWKALVEWAGQAGIVSKRSSAVLQTGAGVKGESTDRAFARAIALRECLYRIFQATAAGRPPARSDLTVLNEALASVMGHARVQPNGRDFVWGWADGDSPVNRLLWPVVRAAGELLVSPDRARVRECASGVCSWLFIDRSPTQRRRWCSMKTCGNRDKVRRFYERKRSE